MIPIALDPRFARLAVAGHGPLALRRFRALEAGGAEALLFMDAPDDEAVAASGERLRRTMPGDADLAALHALWIVGLPPGDAEALACAARAAGVLVNVEDMPEFCDFHSVAEVRRGDLLLTVSTRGQAPGLAGVIRRDLERRFGTEWQGRVAEIGALRAEWRREGVAMPEAAQRIGAIVEARGWLA
ncbi:MAG: precorrin-2 dehydrogenase/sirohydrochlorin ferrochelatase family protein [Acidiphilium sp.]